MTKVGGSEGDRQPWGVGHRAGVGAVVLLLAGVVGMTVTLPTPSGGGGCAHGASWRALVLAHIERYPGLEIEDVYKLLHQASLGSEHAAPDSGAAAARLAAEVAGLAGLPVEPVADTLGPSGPMARIHLRPYLADGGDPDALLGAFLATARQRPADVTRLECALEAIEAMARRRALPWGSDEVARFLGARRMAGFPAAHHSETYRTRHRPAYRVVAVERVDDLLAR